MQPATIDRSTLLRSPIPKELITHKLEPNDSPPPIPPRTHQLGPKDSPPYIPPKPKMPSFLSVERTKQISSGDKIQSGSASEYDNVRLRSSASQF